MAAMMPQRAALQRRQDDTPPWTADALRARLAHFTVQPLPAGGRRRAAVALVCTEAGLGADAPGLPRHARWSTRGALLLTRRAGGLRAHAGQWALPGGRIDAGESAEQAALRELHEEVALARPAGAVLGRLDDYATRSGYVITPVVVWGGAARALRARCAPTRRRWRRSIVFRSPSCCAAMRRS